MAQQNQDNFIELPLVDSTNNYARQLLKEQNLTERQGHNLHGTTIFAHHQWQGKGQRGKSWQSAPGENLQMSLILNPQPLLLQQQFSLSMLVALAVRQFFADKSGSDIVIKWPNDIYFQDRKAGGILIENIITGAEWRWAIVGIGLNINQTSFDPLLPNPVSLKQITGKSFHCVELAKELSKKVSGIVTSCRLPVTGSPTPLFNVLKEYNAHLYKRGQKVKLKKDSRVFETTVKEITLNGQLVVEHGVEERFEFGEVTWVI